MLAAYIQCERSTRIHVSSRRQKGRNTDIITFMNETMKMKMSRLNWLVFLVLSAGIAQTTFGLSEPWRATEVLKPADVERFTRTLIEARFGKGLSAPESLGNKRLEELADSMLPPGSHEQQEAFLEAVKRGDPLTFQKMGERMKSRIESEGFFKFNSDGAVDSTTFDHAVSGARAELVKPLKDGFARYSPDSANAGNAILKSSLAFRGAIDKFNTGASKPGEPLVTPAEVQLRESAGDWLRNADPERVDAKTWDSITDALNLAHAEREKIRSSTEEGGGAAGAERYTGQVREQIESILLRSSPESMRTDLEALHSRIEKDNPRLIGGSNEMVTAGDTQYRKEFLEAEFRKAVKAENKSATDAEITASLKKMGSLELEAAVKGKLGGAEFAAKKKEALDSAAEAELLHLIAKMQQEKLPAGVLEALFKEASEHKGPGGKEVACMREPVLHACRRLCNSAGFLKKVAAMAIGSAVVGTAAAVSAKGEETALKGKELDTFMKGLYDASVNWKKKDEDYKKGVAAAVHGKGGQPATPPPSDSNREFQ
jgi:hypothetical protein